MLTTMCRLSRARCLGSGGNPMKASIFAGVEEVDLADRRIGDPIDLRGGIEPDIGAIALTSR